MAARPKPDPVTELASPDASARVKAAKALATRPDVAALRALIDALEDSEARVRAHAARALGGLCDPAAVAPLAARLPHERTKSGLDALVGALGALKSPAALPALFAHLQRRRGTPGRTEAAILAVGSAALPPALDLLRLATRDAQRMTALRIVCALADARAEADLLALAVVPGLDPALRELCLKGLVKLASPACLSEVLNALDEPALGWEVIRWLEHSPADLTDFLIEGLGRPSVRVRERCMFLCAARPCDDRLLDAIGAVADAIGRFVTVVTPAPSTSPEANLPGRLASVLDSQRARGRQVAERAASAVIDAVADSAPTSGALVLLRAASAVAQRVDDARLVAIAERGTQSDEGYLREEAMRVVGSAGLRAKEHGDEALFARAVTIAGEAFGANRARVAGEVLARFGEAGEAEMRAQTGPLLELLRSGVGSHCVNAVVRLAMLDEPPSARVMTALGDALCGDDKMLQYALVRALGALNAHASPVWRRALASPDPTVRYRGAEGISLCNPPADASLAEPLLASLALPDTDWYPVARALEKIGGAAIEPIERAIRSGHPRSGSWLPHIREAIRTQTGL